MTIEELQEQLLQEQEQRQKLQADYDNLKTKNEELVANNARLTEYNNKLFMRVTEPVQEQQKQKELTGEELEAQEIDTIRKIMEESRNYGKCIL